MGHDDGGCTVGDRIRKDLPGMNLGLVDQSHGDHPDGDYLIGAIKGNTQEVLLFAVRHMLDQGQYIRRQADLKSFRADTATGEFKGCQDSGCLCRTNSVNGLELLKRRVGTRII